tara:strand:+ start:1096 stop:1335 length:240 start_codon:yes stop_codon:yes gene_type:complete
MKKYKFEWLNNGLEIETDNVYWTFAGFDIKGDGQLTLNISLETANTKFSITLSTEGQANDRSDESIGKLMNVLLTPYIV